MILQAGSLGSGQLSGPSAGPARARHADAVVDGLEFPPSHVWAGGRLRPARPTLPRVTAAAGQSEPLPVAVSGPQRPARAGPSAHVPSKPPRVPDSPFN